MPSSILPSNSLDRAPEIVSCWRLGPQITGGRWYSLFHAAPKTAPAKNGFGYVLKMINPELSGEKKLQAIDRLSREAMATEQIAHPNVIRLLDAELDVAPFFLLQPWMAGQSLDRFLSASTQMSLSRILWVMRQVAEAIRVGHHHGRAHLGIEPAHVLLGKTGRVTMLGWSQSHRIGQTTKLTHDQLQLARYTAPECFADDYRAQASSDVYALGALIYHAIAGRAPFSGATADEMANAHRHQIPADLMFSQTQCPRVLSQLVKEMLVKNPARRPSFAQVHNRLIAIEIEHLNDQTLIRL